MVTHLKGQNQFDKYAKDCLQNKTSSIYDVIKKTNYHYIGKKFQQSWQSQSRKYPHSI